MLQTILVKCNKPLNVSFFKKNIQETALIIRSTKEKGSYKIKI